MGNFVCIGGGGGGNGVGSGDGGGGGGYAFAKIDLRPAHGTTINMRVGRGGQLVVVMVEPFLY